MKVESGISGRRDAVDWLVIESIAQKEESVNRYYHKFDIVLIWEMRPGDEFGGYDLNVSSAELTRSASFSLPINAMVLSRSAPPATPVTASRIGWKSFP